MGRKPCCSKEEGLNRGAWTAIEDQILIDYINLHGEGKWRTLPKAAGLKRCGKSCRLRWLNYLRPDIKRGNITLDEEDLIIRLHNLLGNRWSLIAGRLPGRTDNEIKNYWHSVLSKRLLSSSQVKEANRNDDKINVIDAKLEHETALESESSDGSFTLPSSDEEINASFNFRMDFEIGEISNGSEGFASDFTQLCGYDFTDMNAEICEYGKYGKNDCCEAMVENDYVELEANNFNLDSDFGFLDAFS
ncbi:hypothetical protein CCACVL1_24154 [Corchorus capsularis]|uniref:Uncharacterized protein n=1 Tax=Corchorus capsularis TaxID=210143 RepID=A0A1R3GR02_COCAP|nr:hypothetical protein CCACVL1_24154 [Corchorus capsularis]